MGGPRNPIRVLHRDAHVLVVDKPAGLLSVAGSGEEPSLVEALGRDGFRVLPVHRLDREVSGAVLLALDEETRARIEEAFRTRAIRKSYWALAQGCVRPPEGEMRFPILESGLFARISARGKPSTTRYRTLRSHPSTTEVEVDLVTGRYNQIRVHFAHAGFPLVGERKYARGKDSPIRLRSRRVALHSWRLSFEHPRTGDPIEVEAALPPDLIELAERAAREPSPRRERQARIQGAEPRGKTPPRGKPCPPRKTSTRSSSRSTTPRSR